MTEKEKAMQAVVEHLQYELSNQYVKYREERDARKLMIWQLSDLKRASLKEVHPANKNTEEAKDPLKLQLALKMCREDLTKAQQELNKMKAEYWDVVPRRNWDTLQQTHKQTFLQLKTLQGDFDQLKSEYVTLLELLKTGRRQAETHDSTTERMDAGGSEEQSQIQSSQLKEPINSDTPERHTLTVQEFRAVLRTVFPLRSNEEIDELVLSVKSERDRSNDINSSQRLNSLLAESGVATLPPALDQSEENAASNNFPDRN
ncbi:translin-associated factor X-interacting protein 1 isoform X2 [Xiphias gladius]|uniref:translin-associated factor X-interacting protein 1 isoform X2 n=1 Tax=Xiphias gladius TaxID=8245 RepID=UPI001A98A9FB|nr:translin-associated factor X-interacting protein 1 isoform X2 [Xiphias gladius]